ncbi:MAG TPA: hypothetical protein VF253_08590 [Candidatus Limnocylindrales bacterium]
MTPERRHHLVVALIATLAGAGIGLEISHAGIDVAPSLAFWMGIFGVIALVLVLLTAPAEPASPIATPARAGWAEFRRELRRSRRSGRPMTLLRTRNAVTPEAAQEVDDLDLRSRGLHEHLRLVDRTWVDDGSVYILLPETSRAAADSLVSRLVTVAPELLPGEVRLATFPDDGLTSGALISAVHGASLSEVPTPIRAAVAEDEPATTVELVEEPLPERVAR